MASAKNLSGKEQKRRSSLFHARDVDNSGHTERKEFSAICQEIHISSQKADEIFNRGDSDRDSFKERHHEKEDDIEADDKKSSTVEEFSKNKGQLISR